MYEVPATARDALYVKRLVAIGKGEVGFVITTGHLPGGAGVPCCMNDRNQGHGLSHVVKGLPS